MMIIIVPVPPVSPVAPVAPVAIVVIVVVVVIVVIVVVAAELPLVAYRVGSTVGVVAIEGACAQRKHGQLGVGVAVAGSCMAWRPRHAPSPSLSTPSWHSKQVSVSLMPAWWQLADSMASIGVLCTAQPSGGSAQQCNGFRAERTEGDRLRRRGRRRRRRAWRRRARRPSSSCAVVCCDVVPFSVVAAESSMS